MKRLTKEQKLDIRSVAEKTDADIDFSDIPRVVDWSSAEVGKFYRPSKKPVTMRLDSDVIEWLKEGGSGYQTKANWLLRQAMLAVRKGRPHPKKHVQRLGRASRQKRRA